MDPVKRCFDIARERNFKIVLPEGEDGRVLAAARSLIDREIARPVVLGTAEALAKAAASAGIALHGIETIDPRSDARVQSYGAACASRREGMTSEMAARLVVKPLYFAGMMVRQGG
ncbi:MAG: phosphate acyltransferase, partial [Xanthobacteraceae bacterium]